MLIGIINHNANIFLYFIGAWIRLWCCESNKCSVNLIAAVCVFRMSVPRGRSISGQCCNWCSHWHSLHYLLCALPNVWIPPQVNILYSSHSCIFINVTFLLAFSMKVVYSYKKSVCSLFCNKATQESWSVPRDNTGLNGTPKDQANGPKGESQPQVT